MTRAGVLVIEESTYSRETHAEECSAEDLNGSVKKKISADKKVGTGEDGSSV